MLTSEQVLQDWTSDTLWRYAKQHDIEFEHREQFDVLVHYYPKPPVGWIACRSKKTFLFNETVCWTKFEAETSLSCSKKNKKTKKIQNVGLELVKEVQDDVMDFLLQELLSWTFTKVLP